MHCRVTLKALQQLVLQLQTSAARYSWIESLESRVTPNCARSLQSWNREVLHSIRPFAAKNTRLGCGSIPGNGQGVYAGFAWTRCYSSLSGHKHCGATTFRAQLSTWLAPGFVGCTPVNNFVRHLCCQAYPTPAISQFCGVAQRMPKLGFPSVSKSPRDSPTTWHVSAWACRLPAAARFQHEHAGREGVQRKVLDTAMYVSAVVVFMLGLSYAAVPLYQMFCQATGYGGTVKQGKSVEDKIRQRQENPNPETEQAAANREITVWFSGDVAEGLPWKFEPTQDTVTVKPGESTLVFYTAHNLSDQPITGVSTYNVLPDKAAYYFNKIQCFCFEEQRLQAGEKVDMPVFFYIDPEYATDRSLSKENDLTLSYTFFKVEDEEEDDAPVIGSQVTTGGVKLHGSGELPSGIAPPK